MTHASPLSLKEGLGLAVLSPAPATRVATPPTSRPWTVSPPCPRQWPYAPAVTTHSQAVTVAGPLRRRELEIIEFKNRTDLAKGEEEHGDEPMAATHVDNHLLGAVLGAEHIRRLGEEVPALIQLCVNRVGSA
jgi:hypothetical protein